MIPKKRKEIIDAIEFNNVDHKCLKVWLKIPNHSKRKTCPWESGYTGRKPCVICFTIFLKSRQTNSCPCNCNELYDIMNTVKYILKIKPLLWDKFVTWYHF
jgi:hypothetical protein